MEDKEQQGEAQREHHAERRADPQIKLLQQHVCLMCALLVAG